MNRTYELMFIVRPDMVEEEQDKLISTLETAVTSSGGNVKSVEKMGNAAWPTWFADSTTASTCCSRWKAEAG